MQESIADEGAQEECSHRSVHNLLMQRFLTCVVLFVGELIKEQNSDHATQQNREVTSRL